MFLTLTNWAPDLEYLRHSSGSSEPSPQSSTVSHFHQNGMHLSVLQRNCKRRERKKKGFNNTFFFPQKPHKLWEIKWLCHCSTNYVFWFYNTYFFNDLFWRCSALWLQVIDVTIVLMTLVHSLVVPLIKTIYWTFMHSMTWSFKVLLRTII